ncbi:MAG: hypothetical protein M3Y45_00395, partial [Actinomycetota bacterium]|nr:hypothetical protein [Actinomycetota bacterium]
MPGVGGAAALAASKACGLCRPEGTAPTAVVIELECPRPRPATVVAAKAAKELEHNLRANGSCPDGITVHARG